MVASASGRVPTSGFRLGWDGNLTLTVARQDGGMFKNVFLVMILCGTTNCALGGENLQSLNNEELWETTTQTSAFLELRCRGLSPRRAQAVLEPYAAKEKRLQAALGWQSWANEEIIPVHRGCPRYRGAASRYMQRIETLEGRILQRRTIAPK